MNNQSEGVLRHWIQYGVQLCLLNLDRVVSVPGWLDEQEHHRAQQLRTQTLQNRFLARRTMLRYLLASYMSIEPAAVRYKQNPYGKLTVDVTHRVFFNVSHSQQYALIGITAAGEIGVDIEQIVPIPEIDTLANSWFSPLEMAQFKQLRDGQRVQAFYNAWTRKEAFVKAVGQGITYPLHSFSVSLIPGEPAKILHVEDDAMHKAVLFDVPICFSVAAACVVKLE